MKTEEKQQQLMKLQYLQKHIEEISQKTQEMNQQLLDINISKNALTQIGQTKVGTSILTQVANGIFVKTTLNNNEKLIVNIGADTTVEKTIPQVLEMLEDQEEKMQKHLVELEGMVEQYGSQAMQQISVLEKEE
jgi:prefoldin alpha subunit